MRWFGIFLALAGVVAALVGWFSFHSVGFLIGGLIFAIIGMIVFFYGTRTMPK
jgi:hypothetical protein